MSRLAVILLVDQRGWVLLQERDEFAPRAANQWGMVGGHVADGEDYIRYGDDLSAIDDTFPMFAAVSTSYLAGILAGIIVLVASWRRFVRGRRTTVG